MNRNKHINIVIVIILIGLVGIMGVFEYREYMAAKPDPITLGQKVAGQFLIQVEGNGEAWYVHPETFARHLVGGPENFNVFITKTAIIVDSAELNTYLAGEATESMRHGYVLTNNTRDAVIYVQDTSTGWYVLSDGEDLLKLVTEIGKGVTNKDLERIPLSIN